LRRKLIVGIDPGTTVAFSAIDFQRNPVEIWSKRDAGINELVAALREAGDPVMIATDVSVAPDFVLKIASAFNARIFIPRKDMSEAEKATLVRSFKVNNAHERDATASALKAFYSVDNVLRRIARGMQERGLAGKTEEAQSLALSGVKVEDAVEMFTTPIAPKLHAAIEIKPDAHKLEIELEKKNEKIRGLLVSVAELQKLNERNEAEKRELMKRIDALHHGVMDRALVDKEVRKKTAELERTRVFARNLLNEIKKLRGVKTPLKRADEKEKEDDSSVLESMVEEYRRSR